MKAFKVMYVVLALTFRTCFLQMILLFSRTTTIINNVVEHRQSSGQKINQSKIRVFFFFFSKNVDNAIKKDISYLLRIQVTEDLGIYLGIPLLHTRTTKKSFQFIIDKVRNKLTGWDARKLSLVGRITLAQSVMSAIPIYFMQSVFLPACV